MKKKNVLMMALSLCLVAVIAVGGTLAYLSDTDDKLTNTFTFANNIVVDLFETIDGEVEQNGHSYGNVVAGQTLDKDVDVKVTTSFDTWLFVKVSQTGVEGTLDMTLNESQITANGWSKLDGQPGVYYREVSATSEDGSTFGVFETVQAPNTSLSGETTAQLKNIEIDVFAVQKEGLSNATDAFAQSQWA